MTWDSFTYLVGFDWPYLGAALLIGILTGWFSRPGPAGTRSGVDKPYD